MIAVSIPTAALVVTLAYRTYLSAQRSELAAYRNTADMLALRVEESLSGGKSLVSALAHTVEWDKMPRAACNQRLSNILQKNAGIGAIFVFSGERPFCGASAVPELKLEELDVMAALYGISQQKITAGFYAPADNRAYVWLAQQTPAQNTNFNIFVILDDDYIETTLRNNEGGAGRFSTVVTENNKLISVSSSQARKIHEQVVLDTDWRSDRKVSKTIAGDDFVYAYTPLSTVEAYVIVAQPERLVFAASKSQFYIAIFMSVLLFIAPLIAIWWGIDRLVVRWLAHYSAVTSAYANGDRLARMSDPSTNMPLEIMQVANSFNVMADRMEARTSELEEEISRKQTYVRELHHRVKNILQMIASMLAMEARETGDDQSDGIHRSSRRIAALGATYAIFYGYSERGKAPLATVLNEAISRLGLGAPVKAVNYEAAGDFDLSVDLDMSIAIAMLLAELISAFLEENTLGSVTVKAFVGRMLEVDIEAPKPPNISSLGERFIKAYSRQLETTIEDDGNRMAVRLKLAA